MTTSTSRRRHATLIRLVYQGSPAEKAGLRAGDSIVAVGSEPLADATVQARLAGVSGKGVHAALLVAHLQACLRTAAAMMPREPVAMLCQANQMLYRSTSAQHFATLFFGIYDDAARELLYVNCGHNPPLWLRADGSVARLEATATIIGAFDRWDGSAGRVELESGDLVVLFSDGMTEAPRDEEDFGERRLVEELRVSGGGTVEAMISAALRHAGIQRGCAGGRSHAAAGAGTILVLKWTLPRGSMEPPDTLRSDLYDTQIFYY